MKITRKSLKDSLELVNAAFGPNTQLSIKFYTLEDQGVCSVTAEGISMSLRCRFNCPETGQFDHAMRIGLGELTAYCNGVKADFISFKESEKTHVISAGGAKLSRQKNLEDMRDGNTNWDKLDKFPRQITFLTADVVARLAKPLYRMVNSAADEVLKTVKVQSAEGSISLFGTDTFRLAEARIQSETEDQAVVLPGRVFSAISMFEKSQRPLRIGVDKTNWLVETSREEDDFSVQLFGSQMAGEYPNLGVLLADSAKDAFYINAAKLKEELRLHSAVDKGNKYTAGVIRFLPDKMELESTGTSSLNTVIEGDDYKGIGDTTLEVNLRFKYLVDALDFVGGDTIALGLTDEREMLSVKPVASEDEVFLQCLIAPLNM